MDPSVDVILPALDEASVIAEVVGRVPAGVGVIVVDNASTDDTAERARAAGATVVSEPQRGFGAACAAGLAASQAEIVVFCDADGSIDPARLVDVVAPVAGGEADIVLGARVPTSRGAWPVHARLANRYLAWRLRRRLHIPVTDLGPLRAMRRSALVELGVVDRRFGWPLEMVIRAAQAGWRVREVPVPYQPRVGRSKVTGTVRGTIRAIRDMGRVMRDV
jgi:glycosyltransferase involved in cell wall biosynthesis